MCAREWLPCFVVFQCSLVTMLLHDTDKMSVSLYFDKCGKVLCFLELFSSGLNIVFDCIISVHSQDRLYLEHIN